jgi:pimeloyl-ACP methyl ester carboxylesterase
MVVAIVLIVIAALIILALILEALALRRDPKRCPPPGRIVELDGAKRHLLCRGQGRPTVVLEAGLGDAGMVWADVQAKLAGSTRACSYDRAGLGWSEPAAGTRTAEQMAVELEALLRKAGEHPPYVLVGHSSGCHILRMFANKFPEQVAGMVLIDPPVFTEFAPAMTSQVAFMRRSLGWLARLGVMRRLGNAGRMDLLFEGMTPPADLSKCAGYLYRPAALQASLAETAALPETIRRVNEVAVPGAWRDWPVTIISAHKDNPRYSQIHQAQRALAELSSRGEHKFFAGSHFVHFQHPDFVVDAILQVVRKARAERA